jgi:hypothetical protein
MKLGRIKIYCLCTEARRSTNNYMVNITDTGPEVTMMQVYSRDYTNGPPFGISRLRAYIHGAKPAKDTSAFIKIWEKH